jgi:hypothetical protein
VSIGTCGRAFGSACIHEHACVEKARRALHAAETTRDRELLAASTPPPGVTTVVTNQMIDTINADVHAACCASLTVSLAASLPLRLARA